MSYKNLEVIVGNIRFNPHNLRQFLKKNHYWVSYDKTKESFSLQVNDGRGGMELFEVRNASHENAEKFSILLGLELEEGCNNMWSKFNPTVYLHNDGSEDAEKIRTELLKLSIPFRESRKKNKQGWSLQSQLYEYNSKNHGLDYVLREIIDLARRNKKELETLP